MHLFPSSLLPGYSTNVTVRIRGVAINGTKRVKATPYGEHAFPQGQIEDWSLAGVTLKPGANPLLLSSPGSDRRNAVLLVEDIRIEP